MKWLKKKIVKPKSIPRYKIYGVEIPDGMIQIEFNTKNALLNYINDNGNPESLGLLYEDSNGCHYWFTQVAVFIWRPEVENEKDSNSYIG